MIDKPILKDVTPTHDEIMSAVFGQTKLAPCNQHRINGLRSCANWLRTRANMSHAQAVDWSHMMITYAEQCEEVANMIEQVQNS